MICIENQYFSLNRTLLLAMGLWPYKQSKLIRFQFIFLLSILTSAILFQFTTFLTGKQTIDLVIKVLSTTFFFILCLIKYISFAVNIENVKYLLTQLEHVYSSVRDEYENVIIEKYNNNAIRYTVRLTILAACSVFAFLVAQFWLNIVGFALPRNISQSRHLVITTEYFVDEEKYFYLLVLHTYVAFFIGCNATLSIGTMLIAYLQHTCGMFKISSYRIERTMRINMLQNINLKNEKLIFEGIICAIDIHRQAMKLSKLLVSKFEIMLFCLIAVGVTLLSLNLFRINPSEENIIEFLFPIGLIIVFCIVYMFTANYVGQEVMDHNNHMFVTAYSVQWYVAPLHIQKIILFLLQRSAKNFTLDVGGLFTGSLECFATLVKTSVSYFTIMHSIQ